MTTFHIPSSTATTPTSGTSAVPIGSAMTDETGAPTGHVTDVAEQVLRRLIMFFRTKERASAYVRAQATPIQTLETLLYSVYERGLDIDANTGVMLDAIGSIVGEGRLGRTDAEYRPALRARIAINQSNGLRTELYNIMELLVPAGDYALRRYWPASLVAEFADLEGADIADVARMLREAVAGGVRLDVGVGGGAIGSSTGVTGGIIGESDGSPVGFLIGEVA